MKNMLAKVGWKKDFLDHSVPYMAISGWMGDNLVKPTTKMAWWKGQKVKLPDGSDLTVVTLYDCFEKMCKTPERPCDAPMRLPISGIYKIKGVGDVFQIEMHHKAVLQAKPGDNVGMNVKNLEKQN